MKKVKASSLPQFTNTETFVSVRNGELGLINLPLTVIPSRTLIAGETLLLENKAPMLIMIRVNSLNHMVSLFYAFSNTIVGIVNNTSSLLSINLEDSTNKISMKSAINSIFIKNNANTSQTIEITGISMA